MHEKEGENTEVTQGFSLGGTTNKHAAGTLAKDVSGIRAGSLEKAKIENDTFRVLFQIA